MAWPEVSIEDFPPERDDEPESLRQDILDELADHFVCALSRELLKNSDQQLARERVIKQFGDPIKVARQLWFDAMKEKMMSQRIMTGVCVVMAVCCLAVVGIAWSLMKESQAINQNLMAQLAAIAERPEPVAAVNQDREILKQLDELKQAQRDQNKSSAEEMNSISIQLVQEGNIEKPAVGFTGQLTKAGGKTDSFSLSAVSDKSGKLDFGKLPWGKYSLKLHAPWKGSVTNSNFTTIPGRGYSQTIVCPVTPPAAVSVQFQISRSGKEEGEWNYLLCDFRNRETSASKYQLETLNRIQGRYWSYMHDLENKTEQGVFLIDMKNNQAISCPLTAEGKFKDIKLKDVTWNASVKTIEGRYQTPVIYLIRKNKLATLSDLNSLKHFSVIEGSPQSEKLRIYIRVTPGIFLDPFEKLKLGPRLQRALDKKYSITSKLIHGIQPNKSEIYIATNEQPNVWEIKIPQMQIRLPESDSLSSVP